MWDITWYSTFTVMCCFPFIFMRREQHFFTTAFLSPIVKNSQPRQAEPQPAGTGKWPVTLRFGKILGTTSIVRSMEDPQDVLQKIHRP